MKVGCDWVANAATVSDGLAATHVISTPAKGQELRIVSSHYYRVGAS